MKVDPQTHNLPPDAGGESAHELDRRDPLAGFRYRFHLPHGVYLCGHSLGLQPKATRGLVEQELDSWAQLGVAGHFRGQAPWYTAPEQLCDSLARLVGALPGEVVTMNALTVNLHLMLTTFYRPRGRRTKLLIDAPCFPSDLYAASSQVRQHGLDPAEHLLTIGPRPGEALLDEADVEALLSQRGDEVALCLFAGINFLTGQYLDVARLTRAAHAAGAVVGWDMGHAVGNVELRLHEWDVDFAVWCSYKYLNAGPGAVAGAFVHERHGVNPDLPRLAGWWGNDPATRFRMQLQPSFVPREGAAGWQVSNPPILALTPLKAALALFDEAGMPALRAKSVRLTDYLLWLLDRLPNGSVEVLTPLDPGRRGCQLSLRVRDGRSLLQHLNAAAIVCDFREPDVIRVAPTPLYNSFHDVWRFATTLAGHTIG